MGSARTLYDKAVANLRTAQILFDHDADDEEQINAMGYHLQQAMELALKYLLEQNGVEYPKTHDIDQLIRMGREAGAELYLPEYLEDHAEMLSQWGGQVALRSRLRHRIPKGGTGPERDRRLSSRSGGTRNGCHCCP